MSRKQVQATKNTTFHDFYDSKGRWVDGSIVKHVALLLAQKADENGVVSAEAMREIRESFPDEEMSKPEEPQALQAETCPAFSNGNYPECEQAFAKVEAGEDEVEASGATEEEKAKARKWFHEAVKGTEKAEADLRKAGTSYDQAFEAMKQPGGREEVRARTFAAEFARVTWTNALNALRNTEQEYRKASAALDAVGLVDHGEDTLKSRGSVLVRVPGSEEGKADATDAA
jgi:hypothetical protein